MKPVFVFGPSRSGTTLLASRLASSPAGRSQPEMQYIYHILDRLNDKQIRESTFDTLLSIASRDHSFANLDLSVSSLKRARTLFEEAAGPSLHRFISTLVLVHGGQNNWGGQPEFFIEHSPVSRRYVDRLSSNFDNPLFIWIYRDPRAVFSSVRPLDWGPNTAGYFANWWNAAIAESAAAVALNFDQSMIIAFEKLLTSPKDELARIAKALGIVVDDHMLSGGDFIVAAYTSQQHQLVSKAIDPKVATAWKRKLSDSEIATIEHKCGPTMDLLGYSREGRKKHSPIRFFIDLLLEWPISYIGRRRMKNKRRAVVLRYQERRYQERTGACLKSGDHRK